MRSLLVSLLVMLAVLLVANSLPGQPSEAAPATPQPTATVQQSPARSQAAPATPQPAATVQRSPGRAGRSPTLLGDINNDGIVDIRDYGIWRLHFGDTGPTVTPTSNTTPTATPTATPALTGRAYVTNNLS